MRVFHVCVPITFCEVKCEVVKSKNDREFDSPLWRSGAMFGNLEGASCDSDTVFTEISHIEKLKNYTSLCTKLKTCFIFVYTAKLSARRC